MRGGVGRKRSFALTHQGGGCFFLDFHIERTQNIQSVDTLLPKLPTDALAQQLYNANQVKSIM